jgi:hypothetical protein
MLKQHRTYVSNYFAWRLTPGQVKSSQVLQLQCFSPVPCQDPVYGGPDPLGVLELVLDTPRARRARLGCKAAPTAQ